MHLHEHAQAISVVLSSGQAVRARRFVRFQPLWDAQANREKFVRFDAKAHSVMLMNPKVSRRC